MTKNFPTSLDDSTTIPVESSTTKLSVNHVNNHTNVREMIIAIETKIGINGSADTTSHDYKLSEVISTDKAVGKSATQTLTNKTLTSPIINVGSDATGDIYYRNSGGSFTRLAIGTNGYILKIAAGLPSWAQETTTANASTTVAGIVEEATVAEFDARTDTGGTGARLFIVPSTIDNLNKQTFTAGAAITAGQALHVSPYSQSDGGVLLDTHSATAYANVTNQSMPFTVASNSNRCLLVAVVATSAPSGVTYNSVAMTLVDSQAFGGGTRVLYVYRLVAPATGANNITVTGTGIDDIAGASYYNVDQTTPIDASSKASGVAGGPSSTITTVTGGAFVHSFAGNAGLSGLNSVITTYNSKYMNGSLTATVSRTANSSSPMLASSTVGKFNQAFATTISSSFGGGSGTPFDAIINVALKPATAQAGGVFPTNSSAITINEPLIDFIGFADSSVAAGASVKVTTSGVVTGLSGLTTGARYYLQDSNGTIGTSRGTYGKFIGVALSSTTLLIIREKTMGAAIVKAASYTYTAETDGMAQLRGANTIITDGITYTGVASGTMTVPVSRGKTYIFSGGADIYFTPLA